MIKIDELDIFETYQGYQVGKGPVAAAIQNVEFELLEEHVTKLGLEKSELASHTFSVWYDFKTRQWQVTESHLKHHGVKTIPFEDWILTEKPELNFVYPAEINVETLKLYSLFNPGYSLGQIGELAISKFFKAFKGADLNGKICSELSADSLEGHDPCFIFKVAPHCTVPAHIQLLDPKYRGEINEN